MGKVFLVGAGPGDPGLLTVRAARLLGQANVVLHDALVSAEILQLVNPNATVIDVGKRKGVKLLTQDEINALLIAHACENETVVRLKGGDPSLFGRAGEEIGALVAAGVSFEIVPGITAAMAGAAAAGISLTDRRVASSVSFVTAQLRPGAGGPNWKKLVATGATLAIYMPGENYGHVAEQLCAAGLDERTPCTIVSQASRSGEQVLRTSLASLTAHEGLPAPSIMIVGECARGAADSVTVDLRTSISRKNESVVANF